MIELKRRADRQTISFTGPATTATAPTKAAVASGRYRAAFRATFDLLMKYSPVRNDEDYIDAFTRDLIAAQDDPRFAGDQLYAALLSAITEEIERELAQGSPAQANAGQKQGTQ